jgi:hypothetical protein
MSGGGGGESGQAEASQIQSGSVVIRSWDETDDVRLREALERGDGKKTWSQIARDAFPDGAFGKADCQAVRCLLPLCSSFNCATLLSPPLVLTMRAGRELY